MQRGKGFTLIELLVVIAILAVLTTIGMVLYSGVTKNAKDAKRKSDIESLAKAYEVRYQNGNYPVLQETDFATGIPKPPEGGNYSGLLTSAASSFIVCAALEANPSRTCTSSSNTCFCMNSIIGTGSSGGSGGGGGSGEGSGCLFESAHNYLDNSDINFGILTNPDTSAIRSRLHFTRVDIETFIGGACNASYADKVIVSDSSGNNSSLVCGLGKTDYYSTAVPGRDIKVSFKSDNSVNYWGFCIDKIETAP